MKRDPDIVRNLLLALEKDSTNNSFSTKELPVIEGVSPAVVLAHATLLIEANFLTKAMDQYGTSPRRDKFSISWSGYDFLDSVRDEGVWHKTKETARKAGGQTFDILIDVARAVIAAKAKELLGVAA